MSFFKNIILKNNFTTKKLLIKGDNPINIQVIGDGVNIDNIDVCLSGDNLQKSYVKLSGNFNNSNINLNTSCTLEADTNFKINLPIVLNTTSSDTVVLMGNFTQTNGIVLNKTSNIFASDALPPKNLILKISPIDSSSTIYLNGNFLNTTIVVDKPTNIKCNGLIGELVIQQPANNTLIQLESDTSIGKLKANSKVYLEGESSSINKTIKNAEGISNIKIRGIYEYVKFENGLGTLKTRISNEGMYYLTGAINNGSKDILIGEKVEVKILKDPK
ncbi:hypothetical protein [Clostridium lundense]|uniref:hypothetical protein n=1 Tax=Clostridium lundense TaxID=319475 RepID=UPI000489832E|nr:hypothetical protein [Clostridium lundense]